MSGHDDLGGGGHAHGVPAQGADGANLRRGLVLGAIAVEVDALPQGDVPLPGRLAGQVQQTAGIQVGGVGKADAEPGQILPPEGGLGEHLDLVSDEHQVARLPAGVDTAGGVGDNEGVAAQQAQHPDGVGHRLVGVALIVVHPALHDGHPLSLQLPKHQAALVAGGGGGLEVGDILIVDENGVFHLIPQVAQAGAQHHSHPGDKVPQALPDHLGAGLILLHCVVHISSLQLSAAGAAEFVALHAGLAADGAGLGLLQVGDPALQLGNPLRPLVRLGQQGSHPLRVGRQPLVGLHHHLAQLAQNIVILPVQVKQPDVQLGHVHHLARPLACRPGAVRRGIRRKAGRSSYPLQQSLYLVVHDHTPPI